ncbi:MAG: histidine ammonia-lyase [Lysobacteraceae bacterium]|nr:MAG: histidine ammonia-lyase [Xanthomonadaceae bacterium]
MSAEPVQLDGRSLTRAQLVAVARGAGVALAPSALQDVARAATFLADKAEQGEPIYGVTTGFGMNADKLLAGAGHALRGATEKLQRNLIQTHAVCVGEPFAPEVVRAMLCIRVNTLLCGHSGIRVETLQALAAMLNAGVVPVVPQLGSVGASGDLAPLSHLAIVLIGGGEAFFAGERLPGGEALSRAGLQPVTLTIKEGLALNNGTAQMLATGVLALAKLEELLDTADLAAAMTLDAFAGRLGAFAEEVHALRPHPGQVHVAARIRALLEGSTLADIDYVRVPGKKVQPQDSYSLRCVPQVHGAVRDAAAQAARVLEIELNAVTDNPLVFPDAADGRIDRQVISAGHFHGMPLALAMSYVKAAIPVLASISERRLNKLVDPATSDGLPAFLVGNADGTESGFMIVQYTAAAIVNDLASRAMPASVYSIPTSANAEDHVSMGANEARHVLAMVDDLGKVLALELMTASQALDLRLNMVEGNARPGRAVAAAHHAIRQRIAFLVHDRALDGDVRAALELVADGSVLAAARGVA